MKKILLVLALFLLPVSASAGQDATLLTPDGTLHTIEVELAASGDSTTVSNTRLILTSRRGAETTEEPIPATAVSGSHTDATMAFDAESGTLFVFWLHSESLTGSELLFAARRADGTWSEATPFGDRVFALRENLRIAVTRKYFDEEADALRSGLSLHATWWEWDTHHGEWFAQYQLLTIVNGAVAEPPAPVDLRRLAREGGSPEVTSADPVDPGILSHPLLFTSPTQDSVLVVYGDTETQQLHEVRIRPIRAKSNGRLRVPVGKREGSTKAPQLVVHANSQLNGVYGDNDRMAFYLTEKETVRYVVMKDGKWSEPQQIALDSQITAGAAVDALRRLVNEH
jgi:hypothetical protein